MIKVLFVCLGNICRSPAAEVVFRSLIHRHELSGHIQVDSAGTSNMQVGRPPDPRVRRVARRRGYDLDGVRARQVVRADCDHFDYIFAMDRDNLEDLSRLCRPAEYDRIGLFLAAATHPTRREVPDPYLSDGLAAFESMFDLIEAGSTGVLRRLRDSHPLPLGGARSPAPTETSNPDNA